MEISTILLRHRWRIARWTFAGGAIAVLLVIWRPPLYRATTSFAPQGTDPSRGGLASLAGQFGVTLPGGGQTLSPDYYARLIGTRTLLRGVANDSFTVAEMGGKRVSFYDLFGIGPMDSTQRTERATEILRRIVGTSVSKTTGIVEVSVVTKWRSASVEIARSIIDGINQFNQRTRQLQAAAERRFVEGRLAVADSELRAAENRMKAFLMSNKQYASSPELQLERDRLQAVIDQRRQVSTSLTQSYEEVRLREVRDTPVITIIETPSVPALAEPRGRTKVGLLGLMLGAFAGVFLVLWSEFMTQRRATGDPKTLEFVGALDALKQDLLRPIRRLRGRSRA